jgi:hypothetical protein
LQKTSKPLYGFGNKKVGALGKIEMNVSLGTRALMRIAMVTFNVVDIPYAYKAIFSKGIINKFAVVIHMLFLGMMIPTSNEILTIYGDQEDAHDREYNVGKNQKLVHAVGKAKRRYKTMKKASPKSSKQKRDLPRRK